MLTLRAAFRLPPATWRPPVLPTRTGALPAAPRAVFVGSDRPLSSGWGADALIIARPREVPRLPRARHQLAARSTSSIAPAALGAPPGSGSAGGSGEGRLLGGRPAIIKSLVVQIDGGLDCVWDDAKPDELMGWTRIVSGKSTA
jgi:hypothetical protein